MHEGHTKRGDGALATREAGEVSMSAEVACHAESAGTLVPRSTSIFCRRGGGRSGLRGQPATAANVPRRVGGGVLDPRDGRSWVAVCGGGSRPASRARGSRLLARGPGREINRQLRSLVQQTGVGGRSGHTRSVLAARTALGGLARPSASWARRRRVHLRVTAAPFCGARRRPESRKKTAGHGASPPALARALANVPHDSPCRRWS